MIDDRRGDVSIEVLHRMISYVRAEARRLRVMDVAILLDHAEDAVLAFSTPSPTHGGRSSARLPPHIVEH